MIQNGIKNSRSLVVEDRLKVRLVSRHSSLAANPERPREVDRRRAPLSGKVGVASGCCRHPAILEYVGHGLHFAVGEDKVVSFGVPSFSVQ
jgi:hypothetical protein